MQVFFCKAKLQCELHIALLPGLQASVELSFEAADIPPYGK